MNLFDFVANYIKKNKIELKTGETVTLFDSQFLMTNFKEISELDDFENKSLKITKDIVFKEGNCIMSTTLHNYSDNMFRRLDTNVIYLHDVSIIKDHSNNYRIYTTDRDDFDEEFLINEDRYKKLDEILNPK